MLDRLKQTTPARLAVAYGQSQGGSYAAALAFNSFLTMFPLILGILTIVGLLIHDPKLQANIQQALVSVFPSDAQPQLMQALHGIKRSAGVLGVLSIVGLLWSGTGYFASMEWTLTRVFGSKQRDMLRQRVMGLVMMIVFVLAVVVAVAANAAAAIIPFAPVGGFVVGVVVLLVLLIAIYRFVPNRTFSTRNVLPGAILAAVLTEILTIIFPIYARVAHGFNTYGQTFALFFLLATWLYFMSQLLLLGAVYIRLRVGSPADEGIVATADVDSKAVPDPGTAIQQQKDKDAAGVPADAPHSGSPQQPQASAPAAERASGSTRQPSAVNGPKRLLLLAVGSLLGLFFASRRRQPR